MPAALKTMGNRSWNRIWEKTSQFIVDAYHYINHRDDDELCKKWCNPAQADGSAPNLVVEAKDKKEKHVSDVHSIHR